MKRKLLAIVIMALVAMLALPAVAQAYTWTHVGGDPLVSGGVWSTGKFSYLELNSSKVRKANKLVVAANGQPDWVLPAAYKKVAGGHVHVSYITRGTKVGAMSYGRNVVRVVKNTTYYGQYSKLYYYYVNASKTYTVTKSDGNKYRRTVTYRVAMAKKCGNAFVFKKKVVDKRLYKLYVDKRKDSTSGPRLAGWVIKGKVGDKSIEKTTSDDGSVLVGYFLPGTKINLSEVNKPGWTVVTGKFDRTMPSGNLTLKFVNKPNTYKLYVEKRQDSTSGQRLSGWTINGTVGSSDFNLLTRSDAAVYVGSFTAGTSYDLSELAQAGWEIVSPANGRYTGTMPGCDLVLTFVNKKVVCPPPPTHNLQVTAIEKMVEHVDRYTWSGYLQATVTNHTDGDGLSYRWNVNGTNYYTDLSRYPVLLKYDTVYMVTLTVTDAAGHTASYSLPPFNHVGPSDEPQ